MINSQLILFIFQNFKIAEFIDETNYNLKQLVIYGTQDFDYDKFNNKKINYYNLGFNNDYFFEKKYNSLCSQNYKIQSRDEVIVNISNDQDGITSYNYIIINQALEVSEFEQMWANLLILDEIKNINRSYIIKFCGLTVIENFPVMLFEEYIANLRLLYESFQIEVDTKVILLLKICNGLIFLLNNEILCNDVRCSNILVRSNFLYCYFSKTIITKFGFHTFKDQ